MPEESARRFCSSLLSFGPGWVLIYFKLFAIAPKQDVWAEGCPPLRRVCVLQYNIDICEDFAPHEVGGYPVAPSMRECFKVVCSQAG